MKTKTETRKGITRWIERKIRLKSEDDDYKKGVDVDKKIKKKNDKTKENETQEENEDEQEATTNCRIQDNAVRRQKDGEEKIKRQGLTNAM
ncbi:hypothetical protein E2C01_095106 [Portunus trituberculatus]|uniref:Uncharacterized protein n=1 Tax=Portunus trituberculatus TaxID=210409 RepID=A0A5B7K3D9_PORTR|nr:hypothetical protein [Portunus trituberculatus]